MFNMNFQYFVFVFVMFNLSLIFMIEIVPKESVTETLQTIKALSVKGTIFLCVVKYCFKSRTWKCKQVEKLFGFPSYARAISLALGFSWLNWSPFTASSFFPKLRPSYFKLNKVKHLRCNFLFCLMSCSISWIVSFEGF